MKSYVQALRYYVTFKGRATRYEFWGFLLFHLLVILLISFLEREFAIANPEIYMGKFTGLYLLVTFLPVLAVTVRRLHDSGLSGGWVLFGVVPLLGWLIVLALAARGSIGSDGTSGSKLEGSTSGLTR
ncbi:DUF805 domain-containing protein [Xenorhabdus sp. M]|uniref:DUF805 domain-containing protein n=1 Tax=Xenorhabdus szentirmaii TaxID=290112 RepID=A0AAW3YY06_9GAMM|nr:MULTISPECIES: DUF805 domain-containing protein [unclassified Xenorhabdus]MBD2802935.1 DUF805 domain-containing protein [Xenorhabdus sp. M]MBD2805976.1 DUF805 domain-containing protein [Xenorhabdus sp. ZM]